jgi:hypothetical protein
MAVAIILQQLNDIGEKWQLTQAVEYVGFFFQVDPGCETLDYVFLVEAVVSPYGLAGLAESVEDVALNGYQFILDSLSVFAAEHHFAALDIIGAILHYFEVIL